MSLPLVPTRLYCPPSRTRRNGPLRSTLTPHPEPRWCLTEPTQPMIKAAIVPLGAVVFFAAAQVSLSHQFPTETAVNEAVSRRANRITLRQKLLEAQNAQAKGELVSAAKLYDDSWELIQK